MTKAQVLAVLEANSTRQLDVEADRDELATVLAQNSSDHAGEVVEMIAAWLERQVPAHGAGYRGVWQLAEAIRRGDWT